MKVFRIVLIVMMLLLMLPDSSWGVHKGAGGLVCGSCHTMHNSQGGSQLNVGGPAGGSLFLLRGPVTAMNEIHKLCLQCHSTEGAQANVNHQPHGEKAPKVHIVGAMADGTDIWNEGMAFNMIGAGGNFYPELDQNFDLTLTHTGGGTATQEGEGKGHSVGFPNNDPTRPLPPGNFVPVQDFTCTTCHNYHGTDVTIRDGTALDPEYGQIHIFRNLRAVGGGNVPGDNFTSWVGGITGKFGDVGANYTPMTAVNGAAIWPVYSVDTQPQNSNSYDGKTWNIGDPFDPPSLAGWCATCHMAWHEVSSPLNRTSDNKDWFRHPVDYIINDTDSSGAGINTIDWANYTGIANGFKLPAEDVDGSGHYYANADNTDKVFCLTCHFAHGGPYYDNLRWDYLVGIEDLGGGFFNERGNPVPSDKGCQQCHNRGAD